MVGLKFFEPQNYLSFFCQTPRARAKQGVDFTFTWYQGQEQEQQQEPPSTFSSGLEFGMHA